MCSVEYKFYYEPQNWFKRLSIQIFNKSQETLISYCVPFDVYNMAGIDTRRLLRGIILPYLRVAGNSIVTNFTFVWPCIVKNFFAIKLTRFTNFTNLFCHDTPHVLDSSSVRHQEFIHCTLSNGICHTGL